mmetsp:Transcript_8447/g.37709  ORF Transcript_8447/g.37709 Transcript_8447/m.37709 type:complete len:229 (-) Transcript_8447:815-1501(-)
MSLRNRVEGTNQVNYDLNHNDMRGANDELGCTLSHQESSALSIAYSRSGCFLRAPSQPSERPRLARGRELRTAGLMGRVSDPLGLLSSASSSEPSGSNRMPWRRAHPASAEVSSRTEWPRVCGCLIRRHSLSYSVLVFSNGAFDGTYSHHRREQVDEKPLGFKQQVVHHLFAISFGINVLRELDVIVQLSGIAFADDFVEVKRLRSELHSLVCFPEGRVACPDVESLS